MAKWRDVTMGQRDHGQWDNGTMGQWDNGTMDRGANGQHDNRTVRRRYNGQWDTGRWHNGTLAHWDNGTLDNAQWDVGAQPFPRPNPTHPKQQKQVAAQRFRYRNSSTCRGILWVLLGRMRLREVVGARMVAPTPRHVRRMI